jgi:TDG/mug DNA glycosylase family protein
MQHSDVLTGFAPVLPRLPRALVLGSMPGGASLAAGQYYAHPRNAFWPVMQSLFGIDAGLPYEQRIEGLRLAGIALWDVVYQCRRKGSLDTSIEPASVVVNDIAALLATHTSIRAVFCNGGGAWQLLQRYFVRPGRHPDIPVYRMPSTSPANARMTLQQKCSEWRLLKHTLES